MGLPTLITKQVAKDRNLAKMHLSNTFTLKLILNIAAFVITIAAIFISAKDYETILLVALAGIAMFFFNLGGIYRAVFQAYEIMKYEAYLKIAERVIAVSLGIFLFYRGYGLAALFVVLIFSNAVYYFSIYILVKMKISRVSMSVDKESWKQSLKDAMPFWITIVFLTVYFRIDTVMITFMKGFEAAGWYNAALKIIEVITRIPFLLNIAVFPVLSKFSSSSYKKTMVIYEKSFYYMILIALPATTGLMLLADRIILYFYSPGFSGSIAALQVLAASLSFVFVNYLMGYLLNAIDKQKIFTLAVAITTSLNVALNLLLIPRFSFIGAAFAVLVSQIINFGILYYFTSKNNFRINLAKIIAKPLIANLAVVGIIVYLKSLNLILIIALSAIAYFLVLLLIKGVGKEEFNILKSLVKIK